jgi:hypothetical protein
MFKLGLVTALSLSIIACGSEDAEIKNTGRTQ